jgi:preprotein translocase subunit SecA
LKLKIDPFTRSPEQAAARTTNAPGAIVVPSAKPGPTTRAPGASKAGPVAPPNARLFEGASLRAPTDGRLDVRFEPLEKLPKVPLSSDVDRLPEAEGVLQGWWSQAVEIFTSRGFGTRELAKARKTVEAVRALEPKFAAMPDAELRGMTGTFRAELRDATRSERAKLTQLESELAKAPWAERTDKRAAVEKARVSLYKAEQKVLDALMPEAFAAAREAARRSTGMFPYEVQVMGGALMGRGNIAEMYTGEGKTLAAVMPAYLGALVGHGFHIATVNDYLAERDASEMGRIFGYLGMSVGVLQANQQQMIRDGKVDAELKPCARKDAYDADLTYSTATELGFDYLRDNGVRDVEQRVQRPLYGVIIDEVDAILVDEARVPMIIAEPGPEPDIENLIRHRDIVNALDWKTDVEWDQEEHWVSLTDSGAEKVTKALGIDTLYTSEHLDKLARTQEALQARFLLRRDQDYTVLGDRVMTIGKNGHAQEGRRYAQGLHQAIEAKEGVAILPDTAMRASVTMRDFLGMYAKRAGMTGTALSASETFSRVYGLDVVRVPQRRKLIRIDHPDQIFKTLNEKVAHFVGHVAKAHQTGRPILIGVEWTRTADALVKLLQDQGIEARVLTAKNDAEEAEIIANAGRKGAVTVVTPRGGRGVDIKLGGSDKTWVTELMQREGLSKADALKKAAVEREKQKAEVTALGGLFVMGFEHCDSRRRDDQLRGRAGRQGDPGGTIFYSSLEDPLYDGMKEVDRVRTAEAAYDEHGARVMTERGLDHSEAAINDELVLSVPFDEVFTLHRTRFYETRDDVLAIQDCRHVVHETVRTAIDDVLAMVEAAIPSGRHGELEPAIARDLYDMLRDLLPLPEHGPPPDWADKDIAAIRTEISGLTEALFQRRDAAVGAPIAKVLERSALLEAFDAAWIQHLDVLTSLRQGIGLRSYAQKDPRLEFKSEAAELYDELMKDVRERLTRAMMKTMPYFAQAPELPES